MSDLGSRIHTLRRDRRFSLDRLADLSGSSKSYIWELENKNPPRPSAEKLSAIADALGVTVDYLMNRDAQTLGGAEDVAFFREYSQLPPGIRRKVRQIAKILAAGSLSSPPSKKEGKG